MDLNNAFFEIGVESLLLFLAAVYFIAVFKLKVCSFVCFICLCNEWHCFMLVNGVRGFCFM
jgi:hypothetical protein